MRAAPPVVVLRDYVNVRLGQHMGAASGHGARGA